MLYGTDAYWLERYERDEDDETNEWLVGWPVLSTFLRISRGAGVIDLGCGNSPLVFDLLRDHPESTALAMDIAPGAVEQLRKTQALRLRRNEASASQVTLACFDACDASAWPSLPGSFGVLIDKSTTDGLLCDTRRGAARVRSIYALAGRLLCPTAVVAVVSWRSPEDGLDWLVDVVLGGLRQAEREGERDDGTRSHWTLDAHSLQSGEALGPHIYLLSRRPRRVMPRRAAGGRHATAAEADTEPGAEEALAVRLHVHEVCGKGP